MLNPQLQQTINEEIAKANYELRTFIKSQYYKDTWSLIYRIHKINDTKIQEALEVEVLLYLLNISEYDTIDKAIINEVYDNDLTYNTEIERVVRDVKIYLIDKANEDTDIDNFYKKRKDNDITYSNIRDEIKDNLVKEVKEESFNPYTNRVEILPENYKDRSSEKELINEKQNYKPLQNRKVNNDKYRESINIEDVDI